MNYIDAQAALDNKFLMEVLDKMSDTALTNIESAELDDDRTRLANSIVRTTIRSIREQLEEACKVH